MSEAVPDRGKWRSPQGLYDFYHGDPWPNGSGYSHSAYMPRKRGRIGGPNPQSVKSHIDAMGGPSKWTWELGDEGDQTNYGQPRVIKTAKQLRNEKAVHEADPGYHEGK